MDGVFSAPGDSGSGIGDANNHIVVMITAAGLADLTDTTYVSPYYFIDERVKKVFPSSYLGHDIPDRAGRQSPTQVWAFLFF